MNILKNVLSSHKKIIVSYSIFALILIVGVIIISNDYSLYKDSIVKITTIENDDYQQNITGTIMNGDYKGKAIHLNNEYTDEGVFDDKYSGSDELFVTIKANEDGQLSGSIDGVKRDKYLAMMISALFFIVVAVAGKRGIMIILSLVINVIIFVIALEKYKNGEDIWMISNFIMILFTLISIVLTVGLNKKSIAAILSTIASTYLVLIILKLTLKFSNNIDYAFMEYISSPDNLTDLFMSQILIAGLGAIMDVSVSISSMINELLERDKNIPIKNIFKSGQALGTDIMGPMINVLLFTYICGSLPIVLLKFKNGVSLINIFGVHIPFMWYRLLLGGIGVLVAIPISLGITLGIFKIGGRKNV